MGPNKEDRWEKQSGKQKIMLEEENVKKRLSITSEK